MVLGGGKRLFEGFSRSLELEHIGVRQSPYATFVDDRVSGPVGTATLTIAGETRRIGCEERELFFVTSGRS